VLVLVDFQGALLLWRVLALPMSTRLGKKGLPGTNVLAYFASSVSNKKDTSFIGLSPDEPRRLVQLVEGDGGDVDGNVDDGTIQAHLGQGLTNHVPENQTMVCTINILHL
jgi:hypothetical protein